MADLLQDGLEYLADQMKEHVSTTVVYSRGDQSVSILATLGSSTFTLDEQEGVRRTFTTINFDVQAEDFVWGGIQRTPARGDRVTLNDNVYEVVSPAGERHWRWLSGLVGVRMRIFTKLVGSE